VGAITAYCANVENGIENNEDIEGTDIGSKIGIVEGKGGSCRCRYGYH
jgi:hypothetical protein